MYWNITWYIQFILLSNWRCANKIFSLAFIEKIRIKLETAIKILIGSLFSLACLWKKTEFVCENVKWRKLPDLVTLTALFYNFTQLDNAISIYRVLQRDETKCNVPPFFVSSNFSEIFVWNFWGKRTLWDVINTSILYIARFMTHPLTDGILRFISSV